VADASTAKFAAAYRARGWTPIRLHPRQKKPIGEGWQSADVADQDLERAYAHGENIGLRLGPASAGLVDIDLDSAEARRAALAMLPPTAARFGRPTHGTTHVFYRCPDLPADGEYRKYVDPEASAEDKACIIELRAKSGKQTMVPPSIHPDGDKLEWSEFGDPAPISHAELTRLTGRVAAASLMARRWTDGRRHNLALALSGALLVSGMAEADATSFIEEVIAIAQDPDPRDRLAAVRDTASKHRARDRVKAWGALAELVGDATCKCVREWLGLRGRNGELPPEPDGRPQIVVNQRQLDAIASDIATAVQQRNVPPKIFARGGELVRIANANADEHGGPGIEALREKDQLALYFSKAAAYYRYVKGVLLPALPPSPVVGAARAELVERGQLPELRGLIEAPIMNESGAITALRGYDPSTKLFCALPRGFELPPIPETPTVEQCREAAALLLGVLSGFSFVDAASRANALALLLTATLRPTIRGCAPLFIVDAPSAGTGKGLLGDVAGIIATGRAPARMAEPGEPGDAEWRKRIFAQMLLAPPVLKIDNVERALASPTLAMMLTADVVSERILGESKIATVCNVSTWIADGNNLELGGDLHRRCVLIRLDAGQANPWERDAGNQAHWGTDKLKLYVARTRAQLLAAVFTLRRGSIGVEEMMGERAMPQLGSFELWQDTIAPMLAAGGVEGFLENRAQLYAQAEDTASEWPAFLAELHHAYGSSEFTTQDLASRLREPAEILADETIGSTAMASRSINCELLPEGLAAARRYSDFTRKLGAALRKRRDTRFRGLEGRSTLRLVACGQTGKVRRWRVVVDDR
jgi:hypothetical protein